MTTAMTDSAVFTIRALLSDSKKPAVVVVVVVVGRIVVGTTWPATVGAVTVVTVMLDIGDAAAAAAPRVSTAACWMADETDDASCDAKADCTPEADTVAACALGMEMAYATAAACCSLRSEPLCSLRPHVGVTATIAAVMPEPEPAMLITAALITGTVFGSFRKTAQSATDKANSPWTTTGGSEVGAVVVVVGSVVGGSVVGVVVVGGIVGASVVRTVVVVVVVVNQPTG